MSEIRIDGVTHQVDGGKNLLQACLELGYDLPYFCWHPALGSVGACRLCAVKQFKDADDDQGRIVMACMTPAEDGTRISIEDQEARAFRKGVIEWLMANHPLDCPVCDEGGECHLQDMTVMTGHNYRRHRFPKRTYRNQDLGPLVNHEMNRCIQCYRCVRFYRDLGGYHDLQDFGVHDRVYFGRSEDGPLESPFAGNLVEVCPTGVFTDKTLLRHYARKWDLRTAPSVCQHCGLGCNTTPGERYGTLRRIRARYHDEVNGYFLCDRGRFGYEFVNDERRLRRPLRPRGDHEQAASLDRDEALRLGAELLRPGRPLVAIGSPRASLEANHALRRLAGPEAFHAGVPRAESAAVAAVAAALRDGGLPKASLRACERADAALVLGEDPGATAPLLELALRQAARRQPARDAADRGVAAWDDAAVREIVQQRHGPLHLVTPAATALDADARSTRRAVPVEAARLGFAVAAALDASAPAVPDLDDEARRWAGTVAADLKEAEAPLVIAGAAGGPDAVAAAAAVVRALGRARDDGAARLHLTVPECDSLGLALLEPAGALEDAVAAAEAAADPVVVILENDLTWRAPAAVLRRLREAAGALVVIDHTAHATGAAADLLLPAATFAEASGTLVSGEGRAQRFVQVYEPADDVAASWRWLRDLARAAGRDGVPADGWNRLEDVVADLAAAIPDLARLPELRRDPDRRPAGAPLPRQTHRASGRTAIHAAEHRHEPKPPADPDEGYSFTMEGYQGTPPGPETSEFWSPGWNSIQALNRFQEEIAGPLRGGERGLPLFSGGARTGTDSVPPPARHQSTGGLAPVPLPTVFGGDELSRLAPGVAELAPEPSLALHPDTAAALDLDEGDVARVALDGRELDLPVRLRPDLPPGAAGLPVGHRGLPRVPVPGPCEVRRP